MSTIEELRQMTRDAILKQRELCAVPFMSTIKERMCQSAKNGNHELIIDDSIFTSEIPQYSHGVPTTVYKLNGQCRVKDTLDLLDGIFREEGYKTAVYPRYTGNGWFMRISWAKK